MKTDVVALKNKMTENLPIRKCQNKDCQKENWLGLSRQVTRRENGLVLCDTCFYEINPRELRLT